MSSNPARNRYTTGSHLAFSEDGPEGFPNTSGPLVLADISETAKRSEEKDSGEEPGRCRLTIDVLSDDVLICIFNLYRRSPHSDDPWRWRPLVHVCQRWRHIIFAWPHHLCVRVECNATTDVAKLLDVWPTLPMSLQSHLIFHRDGIVTNLQHRDRIVGIDLSGLTGTQLERCAALMQEPFPFLRSLHLSLHPNASDSPVLTNAFLAESAPRLRSFRLESIQFPTLPKLLLSARNLVHLYLGDVTSTGYISSDAIATCISSMTRLQFFGIRFRSQGSFSNLRTPCHPPLTRAVLPSLSLFRFQGVSEYSEDLMARINAPLLGRMYLQFFYQPIFDIPQLPQFMHRSKIFKPPIEIYLSLDVDVVLIAILPSDTGYFHLQFQCTGLDRQLSLLKHILTQYFPLLSHVWQLNLDISRHYDSQLEEQDSTPWLGFLRSFNTVQVLYVSGSPLRYSPEIHIARVLGELARERAVEVLPMLHTLELKGFDQVGHLVTPLLKPFIDARQLLGHPVAVRWCR